VEKAGGQSLQPDNRHSGLPQRLCGNSISSRLIEKGMVPGTAMAFMVTGGVTSNPAAMGVNALVRRDVSFSDLIFGLGVEFWPATDSSFG